MSKVKIFVDDERICPDYFIVARSADEALELLKENKGRVELLSLDHDLGDPEKDGYWLVKQMINLELYADEIFFHTANSIGRKNMSLYLINAKNNGVLPEHVIVDFNEFW